MYQSLYRKYRPKLFSESIGHEYIKEILKNELITNSSGHAYLFIGVRGTGKTTFAKILSKAFNCLNLKDGEPCLECKSCQGIENGSILDVIEIDAASNTGVDNIRQIIDESNYMPNNVKYRVYIIDEVHMLSIGAFNALLKTLEEPPEHVKFILATTEPHKIPATINSRCQRFEFNRISEKEISIYLRKIANLENIDITDEAVELIANLGDGSVRDSMSLLESVRSIGKKIEENDVREVTGIPNRRDILLISKSIIEKDVERIVEITNNLIIQGKEPKNIVSEILKAFETGLIKEQENINKYTINEKQILKEISNTDNDLLYSIIKKLLELLKNIKETEKKSTILLAGLIDMTVDNLVKENKILNTKEMLTILENQEEKIKINTPEDLISKILNEEKKEYKKLDISPVKKYLMSKNQNNIVIALDKCEILYDENNKIIYIQTMEENVKQYLENEKILSGLENILGQFVKNKIKIKIKRSNE